MDTRVMQLTPEVVNAINEELAYVATLSELGRSDTVHYGTAGQILTLQEYSARAVEDWVTNPGSDAALHTLRKCAAIAIRALLTEGCPTRTYQEEAAGAYPAGVVFDEASDVSEAIFETAAEARDL